MSTYSRRQTKKSLGITELHGVSVVNIPTGNKFDVRFRAETRRNGTHISGGLADTSQEAAKLANNMFSNIYGGHRAAKKAGYWNN